MRFFAKKTMKLYYSFLATILFSFSIQAQNYGSIVGTILDKDMSEQPLPFANILIDGTSTGTTSDFDGLFELQDIPVGNYNISISFLGYESQTIAVEVLVGKATNVKVALGPVANSLQEVIVTTVAKRDSEVALLIGQKNAMVMKQEIGAEEISKKGLSDVAAAVVKTTGIVKQEGSGTIFVRGLGDRYNITLYNGLPLPSNNPSRKNINLELFTSDIVKSISIDKVFEAKHYGNFAGASVDIKSIENKGTQTFSFNLGGGVNSEVNGLDEFHLGQGPNNLGFYDTTYPSNPLANNNFDTSFNKKVAFGGAQPINTNMGLSFNKILKLGDSNSLSIFAVGNFDSKFNYSEGVSRGSVNTSGLVFKDFDFKKFQYETNTTGMLNVGYRAGDFKFKLNTLMINSSTQNQQEYNGTIDVFDYAPEGGGIVQRSVFDRTTLLVNQFLMDWEVNEQIDVNVGISYNQVDNNIPDRRQTTITPDDWDNPTGPLSFKNTLNAGDNHRYYQHLEEDEMAANFNMDFNFGENEDGEFQSKISLGYNGKQKKYAFDAIQFNFAPIKRRSGAFVNQPLVANAYALDNYFNQANFDQGFYEIRTFRGKLGQANVLEPQTYGGDQNIHAGYVSFKYSFNPKTSILIGLRGESIHQKIEWITALKPNGGELSIDKFEFLPSLMALHKLNEKQNLRLSLSKTYTLPQTKERAPFQFEEVTQVYIGNPTLYASTDYNVDLKWEFFPSNSELISFGLFGKIIKNPINSAAINSASNDISYVNSGNQAVAFGLEIEAKKILFRTQRETEEELLDKMLSVAVNFSYLNSEQDLDASKVLNETAAAGYPLSVDFSETTDRLSGASDILFNFDATYLYEFTRDKNIQGSLLFNYFSDQISAFGTEGKGNFVDKGFATLNIVLKSKIGKGFGVSLSARNLLDPSIERVQEVQEVTLLSYKKGITVSAGLNYTF